MSNINTLIAYLNPKKHKGGSSGTLEYHFIKIDEDFLNENQDVLSKNITKSIKKKLEDPLSSPYTQINASSVLYVEVKASEISYYFQKEINGVTKYLTLENLLNNQVSNDFFVALDDSNFVKIEEQDQLYYHKAQEAIYILNIQLAETQIFSKRALYYNPKELGGLTNGQYSVDYKDAKGHTNSFWSLWAKDLFDAGAIEDFKKRKIQLELNPKEGNLYWYPDKVISNNNEVTLFYDYHPTENDDFEVDPHKEDFAIKLKFNDVEGFLGFMVVTYFQNGISILDTSEGSNKYNFCKKYLDILYLLLERSKNNINEALTYLYYIPSEVFETEVLKYRDSKNKEKATFGASYLWKTIGVALEGMLTNYGTNKEDIILKLLHGIKITQKDEEYKVKEKNDEVLKQLLIRETSSKNSYLLTLYGKLNTSSFVAYNTFIYKLWRNSSFTDPANEVFSKTSPLVETKNPNTPRLILPYKTNKLAGFYSSNMNLEFTETGNIVVTPHESVIADVVKVLHPDLGELVEKFTEEDWQSEYHPLQPVFIADASKDKAIAVQRFSPMLLLKANEDKSFWSNMATAGEYGLDVITTLSGVGNLAKFRHLARIVKTAEALNKSNKFIRTYTIYKTVKGAAAGAEITSGTVNALLKITNVKEKELGKAISEFLFWLELASLSGEIALATKNGIKSTAKKLFKKETEFEKLLEKQVNHPDPKKRISRVDKYKILKELREIAELDIDTALKDYLLFRPKLAHKVNQTTKLWRAKSLVSITKTEIIELFTRHLDDFPGLVKGHNQADFKIKFFDKGKQVDEVSEFSLSGYKQRILDRFGNPPKLPVNTIDVFENYDEFTKFVTGAYDLTGKPRKYDSEIKFIYNFLKNHVNKADEFVIETSNIFATCTSCSREFVMLEEYLKTLGKKVKFVVKTDEAVSGFTDLKELYPEIKGIMKKYERMYDKLKKKK